jgi:hypothetical protein
MDPIYHTDSYPREGCIVSIDVQKDGYALRISSPTGEPMEFYGKVRTPRAIGRLVEEWCAGFVPRRVDRLDHLYAAYLRWCEQAGEGKSGWLSKEKDLEAAKRAIAAGLSTNPNRKVSLLPKLPKSPMEVLGCERSNASLVEPQQDLITAQPRSLWSMYRRWSLHCESFPRPSDSSLLKDSPRMTLGYAFPRRSVAIRLLVSILVLMALSWAFLS